MSEDHQWWKPIVHFAGHTAAGVCIYLIIALPALLLGEVIHRLPHYLHVTEFTLTILTVLEHSILVIDSLLFLVYLTMTAYTAVREKFR